MPQRSRPLDIVYVDDERDLRDLVTAALELDEGIAVRTYATAGEAWRGIELRRPDLIVLDVMMPDVDGPALFEALKCLPNAAGVPIVFMTTRTLQTELDRLYGLHPAGVVRKPFETRALAARMRGFLSQQGSETIDPKTFEALTDRVRRRFRDEAAVTAARLTAGAHLPGTDRDSARWIAHGLCGSAGTLGFTEIATLAAEIDLMPADMPVDQLANRLAAALQALVS